MSDERDRWKPPSSFLSRVWTLSAGEQLPVLTSSPTPPRFGSPWAPALLNSHMSRACLHVCTKKFRFGINLRCFLFCFCFCFDWVSPQVQFYSTVYCNGLVLSRTCRWGDTQCWPKQFLNFNAGITLTNSLISTQAQAKCWGQLLADNLYASKIWP